jgi:hypothetical protein
MNRKQGLGDSEDELNFAGLDDVDAFADSDIGVLARIPPHLLLADAHGVLHEDQSVPDGSNSSK